MFNFHYQQGRGRRRLHRVTGDVCSIGSARSNDLVIDTRMMGKRHAELKLQADGIHLRDLGSLHGCWVNRERIVEHGPLNELDEIDIGDLSIVLAPSGSAITSLATGVASGNRSGDASRAASGTGPGVASLSELRFSSGIAPGVDSVATRQVLADAAIDADIDADREERLAYWGAIIHEQLLEQMDLRRKDVNRMSDEELRTESVALIRRIVESLDEQIPDDLDLDALQRNVLNESVGLGPLEQFLDDPDVTEIMVNNHREIFVEKDGRLERSRFRFSSDQTVYSVIERIITPLGRRIDESSPIVDARLKDGSRVNAIIPPLALKGPSLTIRKFPERRLEFADLVASGSINQSMVDFLDVCVRMRKNIIVSGGTGSGKTTLLNVLSNFIPETDRIVTIEDAAELRLAQPNIVSLESRPPNLEGKGSVPIRDLVRNALRMRPDRIIVGECRSGEALDMLQAMNTGHDGSLTTIHANNPRDVVSRLEVLVLMAGMELPVTAIREQIASAVDLIIQQTRYHCGARKVSRITEVVGVESGTVQLQDIFLFEQRGVDGDGRVNGVFRPSGAIPVFYESLREIGIEVDLDPFLSEDMSQDMPRGLAQGLTA